MATYIKKRLLPTKSNKLLQNNGKVLVSNLMPLKPVCAQFIKYNPQTYTFKKVDGVPTSSSGSELRSYFKIPLNLSGDFEIYFYLPIRSFYLTFVVYSENSSFVRGVRFGYGALSAVTKVDKQARVVYRRTEISATYFKPTESDYKRGLTSEERNNQYFTIRRINGIVTIYIAGKIFHRYGDNFLDNNLSIYGLLQSVGSTLNNLQVKQL